VSGGRSKPNGAAVGKSKPRVSRGNVGIGMESGPVDNERILGFVEDCRDAHFAPVPRWTPNPSGAHRSLDVAVGAGVDQLLSEGRRTKMPAYPDHGVVLP
jgi:hypothetical protein